MTTTTCIARQPESNVGYHIDACRCPGCRKAAAEYARTLRRQSAYGRWQPYVDAEPARQHVRSLMAQGIGWQRICAIAGVRRTAVGTMLYGRADRPPSKRIRPQLAEALLAVTYRPALVADGVTTDATGTRRRIEALLAVGWSISEQARQLGRDYANYHSILASPAVTVGSARMVAALYDRLWDQAAPPGIGTSRALLTAERRGYAKPLEWDNIDDPDEVPHRPAAGDDQADEVLVKRTVRSIIANRGRISLIDLCPRDVDQHAVIHALAGHGLTHGSISTRTNINGAKVKKLLTVGSVAA